MVELSELQIDATPIGGPIDREEQGRKPKRFLKPMTAAVRNTITNLLGHVGQGCLSDPPADKVKIHRVNPNTDKAFTARSTGTNEVDNRALNRLLNSAVVGIARAERVLSDHYEQSNLRKRVRRLGEEEPVSCRLDKMLLLNSFAQSCGYENKDLPAQGITAPPQLPFEEFLGLDFELPDNFKPAEASVQDLDDDQGEEGLADLANMMLGEDWLNDEDVPVDASQFQLPANLQDDAFDPIGLQERHIPVDVAATLPSIRAYETTLEAYKR
ncbi:hypothetical protein SEMRO_976_G226890.1 [Seminavis robusta]|uniref:Uncharacterized protein n=1 Tax=Seminavis robusta TaxID=568900 RepID=A0A9N8EEW3_9STRA|nr:hypothetical protein SEMRO_976_G226890.1 [Seminavis robusta]|eukprot:Sro976_g226890.1 n/a (270) ;mRNA; f:1461-2270